MSTREICIKNSKIYIDGKERQIISGAIHYFRSMSGKWDQLMEKARGFGLDAVETYFAWDQHEPRENEYDFSGNKDFCRFIECAAAHDLLVILRPGPFVCAEWNNGGLPPWLTNKENCRIRRDDPTYMQAVEKWFGKLLPMLAPYQYHLGGPVIMSVVENEYGSYGCDKVYLEKLKQMFVDAGFTIPLLTADGGGDQNFIYGGMLDGCPVSLTMGPDECMKKIALKNTFRKEDPDFCMEFWCGTFDHWGIPHKTPDQQAVVREFEAMLANGVSVNFYMFHGGTNFGFFSGANSVYGGEGKGNAEYAPITTSYDYNAPLDESGEPTELFLELHRVLRKYRPQIPEYRNKPQKKTVPQAVHFNGCAVLFEHLDELGKSRKSRFAEPMGKNGCYYGFQLCRTAAPGPFGNTYKASVSSYGLRDRAQIFCDGKYVGDLDRVSEGKMIPVKTDNSTMKIDVLLENQGYINFGPECGTETKGIGEILLGEGPCHFLTDWETTDLPMSDLSRLTFGEVREVPRGTPTFYRAEVEIPEAADTFLKYPGVKGFVMVNNFNIGRYWNIGPGDALYIPKELLKAGKNEIIVFEQYQINGSLEFSDRRNW